MEIKDKIKARRIELGLTMLDISKRVGVSEATISRWESGDIANMKRDKIVLLADALRISPAVIMGWEEPVERKDLSEPQQSSPNINYNYTVQEQSHIKKYRSLNESGQSKVDSYLDDLISNPSNLAKSAEPTEKPEPEIKREPTQEEIRKALEEYKNNPPIFASTAAFGGSSSVKEISTEENEKHRKALEEYLINERSNNMGK